MASRPYMRLLPHRLYRLQYHRKACFPLFSGCLTDELSRPWLELPEALTALLIPLPYLLASLAYPSAIGRIPKLPSTLSEAVADSGPTIESLHGPRGSSLLHALALSSATLLVVGVIAKISSSLQPLDRRKAEKGTFNISNAPKRVLGNIFGILLPYYASLQLGGTKTALALLVAAAAGVGSLDQKAGTSSIWKNCLRTVKTRKATCGALLLGILADILSSGDLTSTIAGHGALLLSIFLVSPPLPTSGGVTVSREDSYINHGTARATSPKSASILINSFENTILTVVSGLLLTIVTILYSLVSFSSSFLSYSSFGFSALSIASATALVYLSFPASLRTQKNTGLKLGGLFIAAFSLWEHYYSSLVSIAFLWVCVVSVGATVYDTRVPTVSTAHSHGHSHSGHKHTHKNHDHDHHLHGNHSRLSAFLIARATPGSIIHSVLIEKDSRRIAYFGVYVKIPVSDYSIY